MRKRHKRMLFRDQNFIGNTHLKTTMVGVYTALINHSRQTCHCLHRRKAYYLATGTNNFDGFQSIKHLSLTSSREKIETFVLTDVHQKRLK